MQMKPLDENNFRYLLLVSFLYPDTAFSKDSKSNSLSGVANVLSSVSQTILRDEIFAKRRPILSFAYRSNSNVFSP